MALPAEARRLNSTPGVRRVKTVGVIVNHAEIETGVARSGRQSGLDRTGCATGAKQIAPVIKGFLNRQV